MAGPRRDRRGSSSRPTSTAPSRRSASSSAAAAFYETDALVFGGDLMGKALVPIVRTNGGFRAHFQGRDHEFERDGLGAFTTSVELPGFYWQVFERDEYEAVRADELGAARSVPRLASERLAGLARAGRGPAGRHRRPHVPDGRQRRRAGDAGGPRTPRRDQRDRVRGPGRGPGRRAHDDHGRPVHGHAVGHAARGERGRDRGGDRPLGGVRSPTSGGACSTSTARRRTRRSTPASSSRSAPASSRGPSAKPAGS